VFGLSIWQMVRDSKLLHDAGKSLALQLLGRAVLFFAMTYAMRSLGPEQLGVGAFVLSVASQVAVLGDLGLNYSGVRVLINNPEKRCQIISLVWGARLRAAVLFSAMLLIGVQVFRPVGSLAQWLLAIPYLFLLILNPQWIFQALERVPVFNAIQLVQVVIMALDFILYCPTSPDQHQLVKFRLASGL